MDQNASQYHAIGNLGVRVILQWFDVICGEDLFLRECIRRNLADLRSELQKEGDSPSEKLLIEEVVLAFLRSRYWIGRETQSLGTAFGSMVAEFTSEQSAKSQKIFLRAMNVLRDYRQLNVRRSLVHLPPVIEES